MISQRKVATKKKLVRRAKYRFTVRCIQTFKCLKTFYKEIKREQWGTVIRNDLTIGESY